MKKLILSLVLIFSVVCLSACGGGTTTVSELEVSGQKTEFVVGDEFSNGAIKVVAKLSDGSSLDVTGQAEVTNPASIEVAGTYAVIISYKGVYTSYQVNVKPVPVVEVPVARNFESFGELVEVTSENAGLVKEGSIAVDNDGYVQNYTYEFGKNYTKVSNGYSEQHYQLLEDETVFGVEVSENWEGILVPGYIYEPSAENMKGAQLSSIVSWAADIYGVEQLVAYFYEQSQAAAISAEHVEVCPACGNNTVYSISYESVVDNYYYYCTTVEVTVSAQETIESVYVDIAGYYSEEKVAKDEEGNVIGLVDEYADADFHRYVTASQVVGERTAVNEHTADKYLYQSFDIVDSEGKAVEEGQVINATMSVATNFGLVNATPETAASTVDQINVTIYDAEGNETYSVFGSYDEYEGALVVTAYKAGEYTVVVSTTNVEKSFKLVVEPAKVEYFAAAVYDASWYDYVETSEVTVYEGVAFEFKALVNDGADKAYTAALKEASEFATITELYEGHEFVASKAGTYEIVLTSASDANYTATITVTVNAAPSLADLLVGKYTFTSMMLGTFTYEFTPDAEGATSGTCSIVSEGGYINPIDTVVKYSVVDGALVVTDLEGGMPTASFGTDASFNLCCIYNGYEQGALVKVQEGETSSEVEGVYTCTTYVHPMTGMPLEMVLTFNADGTGNYNFMGYYYFGTFTFTAENGVITFSNVEAMFGPAVELSATYEGNSVTCSYVDADGVAVEGLVYNK